VIKWTDEAQADLVGLTGWLHVRNPMAAERVAEDILECIQILEQFPYNGREGRRSGTRELVISRRPYVVVYRVLDASVIILRVLHGARLWPSSDD
jgi:toxin ParE1/3/4